MILALHLFSSYTIASQLALVYVFNWRLKMNRWRRAVGCLAGRASERTRALLINNSNSPPRQTCYIAVPLRRSQAIDLQVSHRSHGGRPGSHMATATPGGGPGRGGGGGGGGGVRTTNRYSALQSLIADQDDIEDELAHGQFSPAFRLSLSWWGSERVNVRCIRGGRAVTSGYTTAQQGTCKKRSLMPCSVPACSPKTTPRPQVSHLGPVQEELCPREGRPLPRRQDRSPHPEREHCPRGNHLPKATYPPPPLGKCGN